MAAWEKSALIEVNDCVACGSAIRHRRRAVVAPFVAHRIWNRRSFAVDLVECNSCRLLFYNPRLDSREESSLYAGYRSSEYQQMRHTFEPWYTPEFNHRTGLSVVSEARRKTLASIFRTHLPGRNFLRVLDFGGHRGELVRGLIPGAETFVYDIAAVDPVPGVTGLTNLAVCRADLIVNSNVLEHAGFPRTIVSEMLKAAVDGAAIHVEVPYESPFEPRRIMRRIAQSGVTALARPTLAGFALSPSSLFTMHEHVNYFTVKSLSALLHSCGCNVVATGKYGWDGTPGKPDILWCLATAGSTT